MGNLFNNPVMIKLQEFGQKLGSNKFVSALQAGMMSLMGPIMVGAVCQILSSVGTMMNLFTADSTIYNAIMAPYNFSMNLLGVWITVLIAYNYAKNLKMKSPLTQAIDAGIIFLMSCSSWTATGLDTTFLGSTGMFVGFVISFVVVRIEKFCMDKNLRIPMPEVCPPSLVNSFAAIIPLGVNMLIFQVINTVLGTMGMTLPIVLMAVLQIPLGGLTSLPGMFIIVPVALLLWCFGIHGTMIIYTVLMASMINAATTNAALHAAGEPLQFFPVLLFGAAAVCGGSGNTLPLCIFGLKAKSKQIRAISKIGIVPGWFGINEPVTFGMPIMYNPILCIPYILSALVIMVCYYFGYTSGLLMPGWITVTALLPMGFGSYLSTLNPFNFIWDYLMLIPAGLIWYPFFKAYDNQLYAQEQAAEAAENL